MAKFRHRKLNAVNISSISTRLATSILGPEPEMNHLVEKVDHIASQIAAIVNDNPVRDAWFTLPEEFRNEFICETYRHLSEWSGTVPCDWGNILSNFKIEPDQTLDGIDRYHIGQALSSLGCRTVTYNTDPECHIDQVDYRFLRQVNVDRLASHFRWASHWINDEFVVANMQPHVFELSEFINQDTIIKSADGTEVTLYAALAPLAREAMGWHLNFHKIKGKLEVEMEDCTTKQVIEAWPEAEQIIYDVYGYQPNVSKPTNPLSQVIADAGILQIAAQ